MLTWKRIAWCKRSRSGVSNHNSRCKELKPQSYPKLLCHASSTLNIVVINGNSVVNLTWLQFRGKWESSIERLKGHQISKGSDCWIQPECSQGLQRVDMIDMVEKPGHYMCARWPLGLNARYRCMVIFGLEIMSIQLWHDAATSCTLMVSVAHFGMS